MRKGYLDGIYGQVHYYESGTGPTLIMAHQSPVCGRMFERAMPYLEQAGVRAIAIDTPGYGNSDVPPSPPTISEYADAYLDILKQLNLNSAHFLGHHTGGGILCNLAARYPDCVESLILNGPPLFSQEMLDAFKGFTLEPHPIHKDGSHLIESWNRRLEYSLGWTDKIAMHRRLLDQLWAGDTWWYGHHAAFDYDMTDDFKALQSKTLILTNTGDDIYQLAKDAHALRPDIEYVELEGGTHDIVDEQPEAWSKIVTDFIQKN